MSDFPSRVYVGSLALTSQTPSGTKNGVNVTFTLSATPIGGGQLVQNGLVLHQGVDFTLSAATITMAIPPQADDWLLYWGT